MNLTNTSAKQFVFILFTLEFQSLAYCDDGAVGSACGKAVRADLDDERWLVAIQTERYHLYRRVRRREQSPSIQVLGKAIVSRLFPIPIRTHARVCVSDD
jgi:hypothetical protein